MQILALSKKELERVYEYTYKLGMLKAEEDALGYLPDKIYNYKALIEGELSRYLDTAYDDIITTYEDWINAHTETGWKDSLLESGDNIADILVYLTAHWDFDKNYLYDLVLEEIGGDEELLRGNGNDYIAETYGLQYIESLDPDTTDETERKILDRYHVLEEDMRDYAAAEKVIDEFSLYDTVMDFILDSGWSGVDQLKEIYPTINDLYYAFLEIIDNNIDDILSTAYNAYLTHFSDPEGPGNKSLEENIQDIQLGLEALTELQDGNIADKAMAFQYALTIAHHYGTMADHLLGVRRGEGEKILDRLSAGETVDAWNKELEQLFGHPPGSLRKDTSTLWIDPEKDINYT